MADGQPGWQGERSSWSTSPRSTSTGTRAARRARWPRRWEWTARRSGNIWRWPRLIGDKNYFGRDFERELAEYGIHLLRPTRKGERQRPGGSLFKPLRQVIESINETFKGKLDLEQHRGRTPRGVIARVMQRILALTAVIWHNDQTGQATHRSLTAYDH
jgi:hypothetical protein